MNLRPRTLLFSLSTGVVVGALLVGSVLFAEPRQESGGGDFEIVDTPGSTYLLNKTTGQVWRLGFTELKGDRFWFGTHVPLQPPSTFADFQETLRKRAGGSAP